VRADAVLKAAHAPQAVVLRVQPKSTCRCIGMAPVTPGNAQNAGQLTTRAPHNAMTAVQGLGACIICSIRLIRDQKSLASVPIPYGSCHLTALARMWQHAWVQVMDGAVQGGVCSTGPTDVAPYPALMHPASSQLLRLVRSSAGDMMSWSYHTT
jgi:hypothetical protein